MSFRLHTIRTWLLPITFQFSFPTSKTGSGHSVSSLADSVTLRVTHTKGTDSIDTGKTVALTPRMMLVTEYKEKLGWQIDRLTNLMLVMELADEAGIYFRRSNLLTVHYLSILAFGFCALSASR